MRPLSHNYLATLHIHSAGEADYSCFLRREFHYYRLVQREVAFDVVVGYHNVRRASYFNLSNERQSHRNILLNCETRRREPVFGDSDDNNLGLGNGA